jgi:hypothetical protein
MLLWNKSDQMYYLSQQTKGVIFYDGKIDKVLYIVWKQLDWQQY